MKIVITAAGHSRRFRDVGYEVPKFMLPVFDQSMMDQVLQMFNPSDSFLVVTNNILRLQFAEYFDSLEKRYRDLHIVAIDEHDDGPVHTLNSKMVADWIGDKPFIVSYCDFLVNWDYSAFLNAIDTSGVDGCLVSFKGVQPASRGSTLFAYLRTAGLQVLEVKEKSSFTNNRIEEFASVGIYYFKSFSIFLSGLVESEELFHGFSEKYISLVYNGLIKTGLQVQHFPVKQFVCLGTPDDYKEFLYWNDFFESIEQESHPKFAVAQKMIPMAGQGDRFKKAGISVPKPLIPIRDKPMFLHAINSFPKSKSVTIVVRENQVERVRRAVSSESSSIEVITLANLTSGPGETILKCIDDLDLQEDLLITSCDYEHTCDEKLFEESRLDEEIQVIIFYTHFSRFRMKDPQAFAYCKADENGIVSLIVEKQLLSKTPELDKLLVGSFWFRNGNSLKLALNTAESNSRRINGEIFVANSLNELIALGVRIKAIPVKHWISYGDPEELDIYNWWEQLFAFLRAREN